MIIRLAHSLTGQPSDIANVNMPDWPIMFGYIVIGVYVVTLIMVGGVNLYLRVFGCNGATIGDVLKHTTIINASFAPTFLAFSLTADYVSLQLAVFVLIGCLMITGVFLYLYLKSQPITTG